MIKFLDYYEVLYDIDDEISPVLIFKDIYNLREYSFKLSTNDINDFTNGNITSQSIKDMIISLKSEMRNNKIDKII